MPANTTTVDINTAPTDVTTDAPSDSNSNSSRSISSSGGVQRQRKSQEIARDASYYQFELTAIIVHTGSAESGHYFSYIKVGITYMH